MITYLLLKGTRRLSCLVVLIRLVAVGKNGDNPFVYFNHAALFVLYIAHILHKSDEEVTDGNLEGKRKETTQELYTSK